jgi:hypothetical protein
MRIIAVKLAYFLSIMENPNSSFNTVTELHKWWLPNTVECNGAYLKTFHQRKEVKVDLEALETDITQRNQLKYDTTFEIYIIKNE